MEDAESWKEAFRVLKIGCKNTIALPFTSVLGLPQAYNTTEKPPFFTLGARSGRSSRRGSGSGGHGSERQVARVEAPRILPVLVPLAGQ